MLYENIVPLNFKLTRVLELNIVTLNFKLARVLELKVIIKILFI